MSSRASAEPKAIAASTQRPPKLVHLTLIALGSTAVVVPFLFLRRARTILERAKTPSPPIRRSGTVSLPIKRASAEQRSIGPQQQPQTDTSAVNADPRSEGGSLYALKALGIATCIVGLTAVTGVWTVRWSMGVQTTEEFAKRMRTHMLSIAPALSARIYRTLTPSDSGAIHDAQATHSRDSFTDPSELHFPTDSVDPEEWTWADASTRLSQAYEEDGVAGWLEAAGRELEHEANLERRRRGHRGHEREE